jgi:predicted nucleic-acid-binding protein
MGIIGLIVLFFLLRPVARSVVAGYIYRKANYSDKLVIKYNSLLKGIKRRERFANKEDSIYEHINYNTQLRYMAAKGYINISSEELEEYIKILERAGFSDRIITKEEFEKVLEGLKKKGKS